MILGLSIAAFTKLHVAISLIGIVSGLVVLYGMLGAQRMPGWTALFLATTVLTSVTGFMFPATTSRRRVVAARSSTWRQKWWRRAGSGVISLGMKCSSMPGSRVANHTQPLSAATGGTGISGMASAPP